MKPPRAIPDVRVHVPAFHAYRQKEPCWGVFHVALDDQNYDCGAWLGETPTDEERALAAVFDQLSPSQRAKLLRLVEAYEPPRKGFWRP